MRSRPTALWGKSVGERLTVAGTFGIASDAWERCRGELQVRIGTPVLFLYFRNADRSWCSMQFAASCSPGKLNVRGATWQGKRTSAFFNKRW